jgi:hypothetical protein
MRPVNLTRFALSLCALAVTGLVGCATTAPEDLDPKGKKTHYTLRTGEPLPHAEPKSTETPILVDWYYENGAVLTSEGFRGWDFDHDGRFDMLQVLSEDGQIQGLAFDFDGDGRIDATKQP